MRVVVYILHFCRSLAVRRSWARIAEPYLTYDTFTRTEDQNADASLSEREEVIKSKRRHSLSQPTARGGNTLVERIAQRLSARPPYQALITAQSEDLIDHKHSPSLISARLAEVSHPQRLTHTDEGASERSLLPIAGSGTLKHHLDEQTPSESAYMRSEVRISGPSQRKK